MRTTTLASTAQDAGGSLAEPGVARVSLAAQAGYGTGQIAGQVFRDIPSLLLLFFMTSLLGVNPALAGTAIFLPKLIGGIVFDVSAGVISDKLRARVARHHWLLAGAVLAPAAMVALFHVPDGSEAAMAGYIAAIFAVYMAVFAVFSVPYLAFVGDLALTPHQRTVMMAWRLAFTAIGVLLAGAVAPAYAAWAGEGRAGYEAMAWMLAILCSVSLLIGWWGARRATHEAGLLDKPAESLTMKAALTALSDPRFSVLSVVTLLQLVAAGMAYAGLLYFVTYNLAEPDALSKIGPVVLLASVGIVIAQPVWVKVAARLGKKRTYVIASLIHAAGNLGWAAGWWGGLPMLYAASIVVGFGNSGWAMLGFSLVGDIGGEGKSGLYSSVYIALDKVSFALGGALITGLILSAFGFDAVAAATGGAQSDKALIGILVAFGLAPAACNLVAAAIFARWGRV